MYNLAFEEEVQLTDLSFYAQMIREDIYLARDIPSEIKFNH